MHAYVAWVRPSKSAYLRGSGQKLILVRWVRGHPTVSIGGLGVAMRASIPELRLYWTNSLPMAE